MDNILRVHVKHTMVRVAFLVTVLPLRYVLYPTSLLKISTPMIPHPISSRSVIEDGGRGRLGRRQTHFKQDSRFAVNRSNEK